MHNVPPLDRARAERIGIDLLAAIGSDNDRLLRFLSLTGYRPATIRTCAKDPRFFAGVADYVAEDERLMAQIIDETGYRPEDIAMARHALREMPKAPRRRVPNRLPMPARRYG